MRVSLPTDFLISLHQVDCNGTETTLAQCPSSDTAVCLRPGAGVICPEEMAPLTTTNSIVSTSSSPPQITHTTNSIHLTTQAMETITDRITTTQINTPLATTVTTSKETAHTTETGKASTAMSERTTHTDIIFNFNATMAPGSGDSGVQQMKPASLFLLAMLLIVIYSF